MRLYLETFIPLDATDIKIITTLNSLLTRFFWYSAKQISQTETERHGNLGTLIQDRRIYQHLLHLGHSSHSVRGCSLTCIYSCQEIWFTYDVQCLTLHF